MKIRWLFLLILMELLFTVRSGQAQTPAADDEWSVWLINLQEDQLARLNLATGQTDVYSIEQADGYSDLAADMPPVIPTPAGDQLVYCSRNLEVVGQEPDSGLALVAYDLELGEVQASIYLPKATGCYFAWTGWHENTLPLTIHYEAAENPADPFWELAVLDLPSFTISTLLTEISSDLSPYIEYYQDSRSMYLPFIADYQPGQSVTVLPECLCLGSWSQGHNRRREITWALEPAVTIAEADYGPWTRNTLASTNEMIWLGRDDLEECADYAAPGCVANVLLYQRGEMPPESLFSQETDYMAHPPYFVKDGEIVAIAIYEAGELAPFPTAPFLHLMLIDRQGQVRYLPDQALSSVMFDTGFTGTPDGYLYLARINNQTRVYHQSLRQPDSAPRLLWNTDSYSWEILYADPLQAAPDLPPFQPVAGE